MTDFTTRDYFVTLFARILKDYCDKSYCVDCPFRNFDNSKQYLCRIAYPAHWNINNSLDFPNSNKQTDDGSDPFDE